MEGKQTVPSARWCGVGIELMLCSLSLSQHHWKCQQGIVLCSPAGLCIGEDKGSASQEGGVFRSAGRQTDLVDPLRNLQCSKGVLMEYSMEIYKEITTFGGFTTCSHAESLS